MATGHEWLDCLDSTTRDVITEAAAVVASTLPPPDPQQLVVIRNTVGRAMSTSSANSDAAARAQAARDRRAG